MFDNKKRKNDNNPLALLALVGASLTGAYVYLKKNGKLDEKIDDLRDRVEDIKDELIDNFKGEDLI
ncbi:MAG: hypothetical protein Q4D88_05440 [Anaerococcus sp.]|nr:hypothetical protein [Anaerococcus sp.]